MKIPVHIPIVKRLLPNSIYDMPLSTKVAYYRIRMDRTPPQDELFNLCIISEDNTAFIKIFETYSNSHTFIAPDMQNITSVMVAPLEYEWDMKYVDIEKQSFKEPEKAGDQITTQAADLKEELQTTIQRYVPYYGIVETKCLFVQEPKSDKPKELIYEEGIQSYSKQKIDTHKYTIAFLVGGATLFQITAGAHSACSFVVGCTLGIIYQLLLQYEIDRVGKQMMFVNSASRLAIIGTIATLFVNKTSVVPADIWIASTGFLMQKIALWIACL